MLLEKHTKQDTDLFSKAVDEFAEIIVMLVDDMKQEKNIESSQIKNNSK